MTVHFAAPIARFDYRVRIAASLLRSATRAERLAVLGMALTSAVGAWPFGGGLYPAAAIPALLALAALIRHHFDGLDGRRDALAAAGAKPADTFVIQVAGPLCATVLGAVVGVVAAFALGRSALPALAPLVVGTLSALSVRRAWLSAPALAAGSLAALVTAIAVPATSVSSVTSAAPAATPLRTPRSRGTTAGLDASAAWSTAWPVLVAAVLVLAAAQAGIVHRSALRRLGRRLAAAAVRRLTARSSA